MSHSSPLDFNNKKGTSATKKVKFLEEIVREAKSYLNFGFDRYGKKVYGARRERLIVLFNLKEKQTARIFSIRGR